MAAPFFCKRICFLSLAPNHSWSTGRCFSSFRVDFVHATATYAVEAWLAHLFRATKWPMPKVKVWRSAMVCLGWDVIQICLLGGGSHPFWKTSVKVDHLPIRVDYTNVSMQYLDIADTQKNKSCMKTTCAETHGTILLLLIYEIMNIWIYHNHIMYHHLYSNISKSHK